MTTDHSRADRPRARQDLEVSRQDEGGKGHVVVKDPLRRAFFKLRVPEWWLLQQMDGRNDTKRLCELFAARFNAQFPEEALVAFIHRLKSLHLIEGETSEKAASSLSARMAEEQGLGRWLLIKVKAVDPDVWLGVWAHRLRIFFRPWVWPASAAIILMALYIVASNQSAFGSNLTSVMHLRSIPLLMFSTLLIIALHEIAHGLTCRHLGGHVHEMGFLLLYFQPCLYCDLSEAWLFKEKWKKLLVTFSGAYFQLFLGALAVWGWRVTTPGTWVSDMFWLMAVVGLFHVLFNFNPLIKLDGYYMLSDALEIPNLRARAFQWLGHKLLGRPWEYAEMPDSRERRVYWIYGVGAMTYSGFLIGYVAYLVLAYFIDQWQGMGLLLYSAILAAMFRRHVFKIIRRVIPQAVYNMRKMIIAGIAGVALLVAFFVPFDYMIGSPARIEPWAQLVITLEPDGYVVTDWYDHGKAERAESRISKLLSSGLATLRLQPQVSVGDSISIGDTVLIIFGDQFATLLAEAEADLQAKQAELALLRSGPKSQETAESQARIKAANSLLTQLNQNLDRTRSLFERNLTPRNRLEFAETAVRTQEAIVETERQKLAVLNSPPKPEEVNKIEAEVLKLRSQVSFYSAQLESTVFISPISGHVLSMATQSGEVCRIARTDSVRCVLDIDEADAPMIRAGQDVIAKIRSAPFETYVGSLASISLWGDTSSNTATFSAVVAMENSGRLSPGMTGYAKVNGGRKTLAWRVFRSVASFIRIEFWSWWS